MITQGHTCPKQCKRRFRWLGERWARTTHVRAPLPPTPAPGPRASTVGRAEALLEHRHGINGADVRPKGGQRLRQIRRQRQVHPPRSSGTRLSLKVSGRLGEGKGGKRPSGTARSHLFIGLGGEGSSLLLSRKNSEGSVFEVSFRPSQLFDV